MKTTSKSLSALALGLSLITAGSASAGTISISTFDEESDLVNTGGTLFSSANFGAGALSVNGLAHGAGSGSGTNLSHNFGFEGDFRNGASGLPAASTLDDLFSGIGGANGIVLSINGLTIGQDYLFQTYWEGNSGTSLAITMEGDTLTGQADITPAMLISYNFTAGDDTLNIDIDRDDAVGGDPNNWLSGYSLQTIPEPSSAVFMALAGLVLLRRRK